MIFLGGEPENPTEGQEDPGTENPETESPEIQSPEGEEPQAGDPETGDTVGDSQAGNSETDNPGEGSQTGEPGPGSAGSGDTQTGIQEEPEPAYYTVTFMYQGTVFGRQQVTAGDKAARPQLSPAAEGSWDFDFSREIHEDTVIQWK